MIRKSTFYTLLFLIFLHCETLPNAVISITRVDKSLLLAETKAAVNKRSKPADITITIDSSKAFQSIDGFGFTLTGGSAMHLHNMSDKARQLLLQELFGTNLDDIGISYLRLSLGASDLDTQPWSYNDLSIGEKDPELNHFSMANDTLYLIPILNEILSVAPNIKIMSSPWSPPAWMKDNNDTRGGSLKAAYYKTYANYFVRYIKGMKSYGITIDAITVQNEPLHPGNNPSLLMSAAQQATFIKDYLGPTFKNNHLATKIIIYDHNADRIDYPISILNDPEAAQYIDGTAFHLYGGTIDELSKVKKLHPNKNLYFTEQWIGAPGNFQEDFSWHIENLIIGATRNWCKTVLEWNLAADKDQQPHTDRGGCDRCLGALTITDDEVIRNPAYYIIAQASKYVPTGSIRIDSNQSADITNVAFLTPENKIVIIVQNRSTSQKKVQLNIGEKWILYSLQAGDVATCVL